MKKSIINLIKTARIYQSKIAQNVSVGNEHRNITIAFETIKRFQYVNLQAPTPAPFGWNKYVAEYKLMLKDISNIIQKEYQKGSMASLSSFDRFYNWTEKYWNNYITAGRFSKIEATNPNKQAVTPNIPQMAKNSLKAIWDEVSKTTP